MTDWRENYEAAFDEQERDYDAGKYEPAEVIIHRYRTYITSLELAYRTATWTRDQLFRFRSDVQKGYDLHCEFLNQLDRDVFSHPTLVETPNADMPRVESHQEYVYGADQ